jgi:hypothetical protein
MAKCHVETRAFDVEPVLKKIKGPGPNSKSQSKSNKNFCPSYDFEKGTSFTLKLEKINTRNARG